MTHTHPRPMSKTNLREQFKETRHLISQERREAAAELARQYLTAWVDERMRERKGYCLSFASFKDEIDLWPTNSELMRRGVLALPKVHGDELQIFAVASTKQLKPSRFNILEPDPSLCKEIALSELFLILVPALAIDDEMHRLGFGLGYYDKFLKLVPEETPKAGVAFKEQRHVGAIEAEPHDHPLTDRLLF